jgi:hypothetical protein
LDSNRVGGGRGQVERWVLFEVGWSLAENVKVSDPVAWLPGWGVVAKPMHAPLLVLAGPLHG